MPQTWHHGLVARWWAEFNLDGPEIEHYRRYVEEGPTLDVACGTGRLLVPWLEAGLDVDGCDVSADMIELCRERAERAGLAPTLFVQPMHELEPPRSYRTIVVCGAFGIGSTRDQDAEALARFHRYLEPGGTLVLDNEAPYANARRWRYWLDEERARSTGGVASTGRARPRGERRRAGAPSAPRLSRPARPVEDDGDPRIALARRRARRRGGAHDRDPPPTSGTSCCCCSSGPASSSSP